MRRRRDWAPGRPAFDPPAPLVASGNLRRRSAISRAIQFGASLSALCAVLLLGDVVYTVVSHGAPAISFDFLTTNPAGLAGGGIANALLGTALIVAFAALIAVPVGVLIGLYLTEFADPTSRTGQVAEARPRPPPGPPDDHRRRGRLWPARRHDARRERLRRIGGAGDRDAAADRAVEPGGAAARAAQPARGGRRPRRRALALGAERRVTRRDQRYRDRRDPLDCAGRRRDRPAAVRRQHLQPDLDATDAVRTRGAEHPDLHPHDL